MPVGGLQGLATEVTKLVDALGISAIGERIGVFDELKGGGEALRESRVQEP